MTAQRRPQATIAAAVVPPARPIPPAVRAVAAAPSQQQTMAVAAVPVPPRAAKRRAAKPSDFDTQSMPAIPRDPDAELGLARTMVPTARTMIATTTRTIATPSVPRADESSLDIPFEAEFVDGEPVRPRGRRPITLGDGMLQRVPQRRAWLLQTVVVLVTASIGLVAIAI